tara:strand:- start:863 stop:1234 length:372 start_codon:yes stop_codon:yes gene_type:complete
MQTVHRWVAALLIMTLAGCASVSPVVLTGTVNEVSPNHGNLDTTITKEAVEAAGIAQGDTIEFACGGPTFAVAFATTYGDVDEGAWVAFINWDNKLRLARNLANAAETADCALNDAVTVARAQ